MFGLVSWYTPVMTYNIHVEDLKIENIFEHLSFLLW